MGTGSTVDASALGRNVVEDEEAWRLMCEDPRLAELVSFVASRTSRQVRVKVYRDHEEGFEEFQVRVKAGGELEEFEGEWDSIVDEAARKFPTDLMEKAAIIYDWRRSGAISTGRLPRARREAVRGGTRSHGRTGR
ncbi:hypothetical protein [Conexivisphaera calida]|uniref:Uncharacterized protein n=1 Tax=Conexivisphaera calida TaxID=1874277 RepID=A0A4V0P1P4_9ARCH|nr:hypothetical protein [Conexivisphaera calida]BBE42430.1 hypothetical protein NAS2_1041 [Conexivisphaera calida]